MKRSNKSRKSFNVILAILVAFGLWLYVINVENPTGTATLWDMPIELQGEDALEEKALMVTDLSEDTLDVKFSGRKKTLMTLDEDTVSLVLDVSDISGAGEWELTCRTVYPSYMNASNFTIADWDRMKVTVTVEEKAVRKVPVQGRFIGTEAEGFQAGKVQTEPSTLTLEGSREVLDTVEYALVQVGGENVRSTIVERANVVFMNAEGSPVVELKHITADTTTVQVTIPVRQVTSVPLRVSLRRGDAPAEGVDYTVEPQEIAVASGKESLPPYLSLGQIDLGKDCGSVSYSLPIRLPAGFTGWGIPPYASVRVSSHDLTSRQLEVEQIILKNVPEGYYADVIGKRYVWVRGSAADVSQLTSAGISVRADLAEATLGGELQRLPAKVTLVGENLGNVEIVGDNYAVAFRLVPETGLP